MFLMQSWLGLAHFLATEYDGALSCAAQALRAMPKHLAALRIAAASSALIGRLDQARKVTTRLLEL